MELFTESLIPLAMHDQRIIYLLLFSTLIYKRLSLNGLMAFHSLHLLISLLKNDFLRSLLDCTSDNSLLRSFRCTVKVFCWGKAHYLAKGNSFPFRDLNLKSVMITRDMRHIKIMGECSPFRQLCMVFFSPFPKRDCLFRPINGPILTPPRKCLKQRLFAGIFGTRGNSGQHWKHQQRSIFMELVRRISAVTF